MKRRNIVIMTIVLVSLISCGGGGGGSESTGDPSRLYVSTLMSGGSEIGSVFADDVSNSVVSLREAPGSDVIKNLLGNFNDGSFMTVEMQGGVPVSATDGTMTARFSNWTANTVDITLTSGGETETVEDVDFSGYVPTTASTKGWTEFAGASWTTLTVAFCPVSIALAGVSMGAGLPASVVGCSLAATNLYKLLNNQPTLVEQAITYVSAPSACTAVQQGGASISQMQSCVSAAGQSASSNPAHVLASGEIGTGDGDDDGGDGDGDRVTGSCRTGDTCTDYALLPEQLEQARESCGMAGGTFSSGACSSSTAIGSCTVNVGTSNEYVLVYYPPTFTLEIARQHCDLLGGQLASN